MSTTQLEEQIAAATAYEELFVPAIFGQWTPLVLAAAQVKPGQRVLDVACGTGVLAREASRQVGPTGHTTGLDISPGMLAAARRIAPAIDWKQGEAGDLPFPDGSFDAVVSQFGLMFFPERVEALQEMLRVLAPGGRIAVAVFDSLDNIPAYADEVILLERTAGAEAAEALRAPFVLGDKSLLFELAEDAGLGSIEVITHQGTADFPSIRTLVEADLRGWLPVMGVHLEEAHIQQILAEAEKTMKSYVNPEGRAVFPVTAHILTGNRE